MGDESTSSNIKEAAVFKDGDTKDDQIEVRDCNTIKKDAKCDIGSKDMVPNLSLEVASTLLYSKDQTPINKKEQKVFKSMVLLSGYFGFVRHSYVLYIYCRTSNNSLFIFSHFLGG